MADGSNQGSETVENLAQLEAWQEQSDADPNARRADIDVARRLLRHGIDAVKAIKTLDASARVVMVSAMGQQPMVIEAIQAGAVDFIVKPFQPDRVVEALNKALG